jgi:hypothetical protein
MCCWTVVAWMLMFHLILAKNKEQEGEAVDCMRVLNFQFSVNVLYFSESMNMLLYHGQS